MSTRVLRLGLAVIAFAAITPYRLTLAEQSPPPPAGQSPRASQSPRESATAQPRGRTSTRLPDGRWLVVGGDGAERTAEIRDAGAGTGTRTPGLPATGRAWHTATLLSDGTVLIAGGVSGGAATDVPEIFDPATGLFTPVTMTGIFARSHHTATLLTDGRVLVAGGARGDGTALPVEVWDLRAQTAAVLPQSGVDRSGAAATLLADGRVRISGGTDRHAAPAAGVTVVDPDAQTVIAGRMPVSRREVPHVAGSLPHHGATDLQPESPVVVRFSDAMDVETLTPETLALSGPDGPVAARVIAAEDGRLAFVWPATALEAGAAYTLRISGARDVSGTAVPSSSISFTTAARDEPLSAAADDEAWVPDAGAMARGWRANRPPSPWESLEPLQAPPGVTAISGRVLTLDGRPLADVTLEVNEVEARTDRTGRFLLTLPGVDSGRHVLEIDGATASRGDRRYGFFEYGATVESGQTNVLPFTIWMPRLDTRHTVRIPSPTTSEVVVTTPLIPGLEVHLPPQTTIRGEDGELVTELSITPIPVDRTPFPLARNVHVPVYFTVQPGGAYIYTGGTGTKGGWIVYPNYEGAVPDQEFQFFHYDPDERDWYVYGTGRVSADGRRVVPGPRTRIYEFTGAMFNGAGSPPGSGPTPGGGKEADPVDPSTGLFSMEKTDLYLPDVIPLALTRTYNSGDNIARPFGRGMTHPYAMFAWSANQYQEVDLILPDGGRVHFVRTSPGNGYTDAVFVHQESATTPATPTRFYKARMAWNGDGWDITLKDGTVYVIGENAPLQAIRDRYGNVVRISRASGQSGNITQVTSPNGRWISFTYDPSNRVTQAKDNLGRTVTYTYDANGNLATVTDPENAVTTYSYDASNRLATIRDGRNVVFVTNQYTNGRVTTQTLADPAHTYQFAYTVNGSGSVTRTDITDPRGHIERLEFNADHYTVSRTEALGTALERTMTLERQPGSNLIAATVDPLNRRTEFTYDEAGYVLTVTELAGTAAAVTTTYTHEPVFHQLATVTDPLGHVWTREYDSAGRLVAQTDPLVHRTGITLNNVGQVTGITDALEHTSQFGYTGGDLTSFTDPLSRTSTQFVDAGGRTLRVTDPLGRNITHEVDKLNRVTSVADALGGITRFSYDPNGRVVSVTDALNHATTYTYDTSDRVATQTDPLSQIESYLHDGLNNRTELRDRKGQVSTYSYDALNRLQLATHDDLSTIEYVYDAGDRLTQVIDSIGGTIELEWDLLDRLLSETSPEGTVSYTYDADGRRATMTVAGQPTVVYGYDAAHRLTSIVRADLTTTLTYDDANRRDTVTLPNGLITEYDWDAASQLTGLTYRHGANVLGTLTYTYDAAGNRTSVGGTWARTGLPQAVSSALYDSANRLVQWGATIFSYDANGNLASDGATSYTWNARDELVALSGGVNASFAYDGVGRRRSRTTAGGTTRFLYDAFDTVQELTAGGTPSANLVASLTVDEVFARLDASGSQHVAADALGSSIALVDAAGSVRTQYSYAPFGETTQTGTSSSNPTQFTGRENDDTGLYYYRGRYLHTGVQRFVSEDPIGFGGGDANLYAYVFNAPTMYADPSGEIAPWAAAAAARCLKAAAESALTDWASGRKIDWKSAAADCAIDALIPGGSNGRRAARAADRAADAARAANKRPSSKQARKAWEDANGKDWPKDPKTGRNQDAHHKDPIADGGEPLNPDNIEPMPHGDHVEHHRQNGDFSRWGKRGHR